MLQCSLKIDQGLFDWFKADFTLVSLAVVHTVAEWLLAGDYETSFTREEKSLGATETGVTCHIKCAGFKFCESIRLYAMRSGLS